MSKLMDLLGFGKKKLEPAPVEVPAIIVPVVVVPAPAPAPAPAPEIVPEIKHRGRPKGSKNKPKLDIIPETTPLPTERFLACQDCGRIFMPDEEIYLWHETVEEIANGKYFKSTTYYPVEIDKAFENGFVKGYCKDCVVEICYGNNISPLKNV